MSVERIVSVCTVLISGILVWGVRLLIESDNNHAGNLRCSGGRGTDKLSESVGHISVTVLSVSVWS